MTDNDRSIAATIPAITEALTALNASTDDFADLAIRDFMIHHCSIGYANAAYIDLRALSADYDISPYDLAPITSAILALSRDDISELALSFSLCPFHMIDYQICFDNDDEECAAIREVFPSHDT